MSLSATALMLIVGCQNADKTLSILNEVKKREENK